MSRIPGPHTWKQSGVPFFKFPSSLYGKKEGEKGGGEERVRERKRIKYSVRKNFIERDDYSLQLDLLQ